MKWLGAALELPPLRSWPSHAVRWDGRDTFVFNCHVDFSSIRRSVPEPIRIWHVRGGRSSAPDATTGERPAGGRAATTRLTLSLMGVPAVA
jgi:hypothetical protein